MEHAEETVKIVQKMLSRNFGEESLTNGFNFQFLVSCCLGYAFIPTHVGQTHASGIVARYTIGSSPRTWGRRGHHRRRCKAERFIPTHVGQTTRAIDEERRRYGSSPHTWGRRMMKQNEIAQPTVHPHTRGADFRGALCERPRIPGSSPHTWGRLFQPVHNTPFVRFIPTHVGQTF